jgi:RNA polymerase sigma-70 factor (ECF subfamily)
VGLAHTGNRDAFAELVHRRQTWIRNLMRRCCRDAALADDLAQQSFLQAWRSIRQLHDAKRFAPWLKKIAINTWLQYERSGDPLKKASQLGEPDATARQTPAIGMDLDRALSELADDVRLCVVLAYHEQMTHTEIAEFTGLPLGTVKSHIRRGTSRLQRELAAYLENNGDDS